MSSLRVAVVTGTRADWGLLRPLVDILGADPFFDVRIIVTGSHLSERFGMTVREVEQGGREVAARVPVDLEDDSELGVARATATVLAGVADALARLDADLVVILGDRTEALAAASAAAILRIPIVHLHGGEITEGAIDDMMRHAITKLASLHFTSTEVYRRRVIQMGEDPARVVCVGALGVDNALRMPRLSREQLESELGPVFGRRTALVTFHPETGSGPHLRSLEDFHELLEGLERVSDLALVFTRPNADAGNRALSDSLDAFVATHPDRSRVFTSLGVARYLSMLALTDVCVGNSSSGIIEAGALGTPTVDVGDRQKGRVAGATVIHVAPGASLVEAAVLEALAPAMQLRAAERVTPYGDGRAAEHMADVLRAVGPALPGSVKRFRDIPVPGQDADPNPQGGRD